MRSRRRRMLSNYESEVCKLRGVPLHIQESICDAAEDLEEWNLKLSIQIQKLNEESEEKKRGIKASLPIWNCDALEYPCWKKDLINAGSQAGEPLTFRWMNS